jgi:hypothetical protein
MENRCLDCGRPFAAERHTDQCQYCWERDTAIYANVPPNPEEDKLFRRHRRPSPESAALAPPAPVVNVAPDGHVNYGVGPCAVNADHRGPFVSRIGRALLCHECVRQADRVELSLLAAMRAS